MQHYRCTYETDGKRYVAFMAGAGRPATTVDPNDAKVDNPPMLFVFALDGKAELPRLVLRPHRHALRRPLVRSCCRKDPASLQKDL